MKKAVVFSCCLLIVTFLQSQSLVEIAAKEKERRESLKGRRAIVVTNEVLAGIEKTPAIQIREPEKLELTESLSEEQRPQPSSETRRIIPTVSEPVPTPFVGSSRDQGAGLEEIEEKLNLAKEYVELLTLKMNALWQEFYSMDDMTSRDSIQQQISETYDKLLKAQEDEVRVRAQLESGRQKK